MGKNNKQLVLSALILSSLVLAGCSKENVSSSSSGSENSGSSSSSLGSSSSSSSSGSSSLSKATYTVTWVNDDGTVLETDAKVEEGSTPEYNGATPTKASTAQYTYTFDGWDKEIGPVTGNITYTATYKATVNGYTVTWNNYDGTTLETDSDVPYGDTPTYDGVTPSKVGDAEYSYTFDGWDKEVVATTNNVTYTATFKSSVNKYTITFKDEDKTTLLDAVTVDYGKDATYSKSLPSKEADAKYTYVFEAWLNESGAKDDLSNVIADRTVYASYTSSINSYTVTWKDSDGTALETDSDVPYGTTPTYEGETPTKAQDIDNIYTFAGWDKTVEAITGDTTYTATYSFSQKLSFIYISAMEAYVVDACNVDSTSASIPATYDDGTNGSHNVSDVGPGAFAACSSLTSLTFGANIEKVYSYIYSDCPLTSLTVDSANATYVSSGNCIIEKETKTIVMVAAASFTIPTSSEVATSIGSSAIHTTLKEVMIPDNIVSLGGCFDSCPNLETVTIGDGVTSLSNYCFYDCPKLTNVSFGKAIASFPSYLLYDCPKLTSLTMSEDNTVFSSSGNCIIKTSDKSIILGCAGSVIPTDENLVTSINSNAFKDTEGLTSITIPSNISTVGAKCFYGCSDLASVTFLDGVTTIEEQAFQNCPLLTTLSFGSGLTSVSASSFVNCPLLSSITVSESNAKYTSANNCLINKSRKTLVLALKGAVLPTDSSILTVIGEGSMALGGYTELTLPSNIVAIQAYAFAKCGDLVSLTIPNSVTFIGDGAFSDCGKLESVSFGSGLATIGSSIFAGCGALATVTMTGNSTFSANGGCIINTADKSVVVGTSLCVLPTDGSATSFAQDSFSNVTRDSLVIPDGYTSIAKSGLWRSYIKSITLPSTLTTIGEYGLAQSYSLSSIVIPSTVTTIGAYAFNSDLSVVIYAEATEAPATYDSTWNSGAKATYWYSETSNTDGSHWHYVDNVPTVWVA